MARRVRKRVRSVFQGEYQHGLDSKGRLILPVRIREELGAHFILTRGLDGCLYIFTPQSWEEFMDKLNQLPASSKQVRRMQRYFIGSSVECDADKQGRFLIPPVLRKAAQIEKEVTILGVMNRIELWATEQYESYLEEDSSIEEIAAELEF